MLGTTAQRRLRAISGIIGPTVFTAAWLISSLRQRQYSIASEHISGLAAPDARTPEVMISGFLVLGTSNVLFASGLQQSLGGHREAGIGPALMKLGGIAATAAGLLRRDHMLLRPPDLPPMYRQSWKNDGHDLASGVIYVTSMAAPLALARRFWRDAYWRDLVPLILGTSVASVGLLVLFASRIIEPWNGVVQRVAVSLPMIMQVALAFRLLRPRADS